MKRRQLERQLLQLGWRLTRHGHKHDIWAQGEREITVPRHSEINEYTARAIIKDAIGDE